VLHYCRAMLSSGKINSPCGAGFFSFWRLS
jgi:hypothetical protein